MKTALSTSSFATVLHVALTGLLLLLLGTGCQRALPSAQTFVGPVDGSDTFVGLSIVDGEVMAYVCNGRDNSAWLRGTAKGDEVSLVAGGTRLDARRRGDRIEGTVTFPTGPHSFEAHAATGGAGFYRAAQTIAGLGYVGGWIVLRDGRQRGALKQDGRILPTPPFDPAYPAVPLPTGERLTARPVETLLRDAPHARQAAVSADA